MSDRCDAGETRQAKGGRWKEYQWIRGGKLVMAGKTRQGEWPREVNMAIQG
jgi:hypothetical protein